MLLNVMWYIQYLGRKIFDGIRGERSIDVIMLSYNSSGRSLLFDTMYQGRCFVIQAGSCRS